MHGQGDGGGEDRKLTQLLVFPSGVWHGRKGERTQCVREERLIDAEVTTKLTEVKSNPMAWPLHPSPAQVNHPLTFMGEYSSVLFPDILVF